MESTDNIKEDELKVIKKTKKKTTKKTTKKKTAKKKNYLNNKDFLHEIILSHERNEITDKLATMFMKLTDRYASKARFAVTESFKDDMKCFALMTLVRVWRSFNPEKSKNPFAYFTTVVTHAFYQFQNQERKQKDIKNEMLIEINKSPSYSYMAEYEESMRKEHDSYEGTTIEGDLAEYDNTSDEFNYEENQ